MKIILNKKAFYYYLSFLLPLTIIAAVLAIQGIWWGSETTILASDGFHQYVIFNQTLRNALHGDGSLFYTFTSGLGLNFYALSSYYLGSFLSPLTFLFNLQSMPDYLYLVTVVKFGLIGLSTFISLKGIYQTLKNEWALLLSSCFSLMSFSTSQLEISSWLDVFILVPIILLGLHRVLTGKGRFLYYLSLSCLFFQNYYFGYMTAIFLTLWALVQLSCDFRKRLPYLLDFTAVSILSALTSAVMLLPTYLDLKTHGETFSTISSLKTEDSWYLDFFAKNLVASFDTTKFGSIPMIYVGLLPLILGLIFFTLKQIKWQVKLAYFLCICFILSSFYLQPLNLFWQGMHAPNMFLYRYSWTLSLVIIYLAAETSTYLHYLTKKQILFPFIILGLGFLATFFFKQHYDFLNNFNFIFSFGILITYLFLFFASEVTGGRLKSGLLLFLVFSCLEIGVHTHFQVEGIAGEWHFPSRSNYQLNLTDIDNLVNYISTEDNSFYRMETLAPQTGNDSMKYNYNGISQFSSIRNRSSSSTLDKLGFRSDGTNLNLRYQNNTIIADSLFGIRYNLSTGDPFKFGFSLYHNGHSLNTYENKFSQSLAFLTNEIYKDVNFDNLTLDNQSKFLNQLTGLSQQYYTSISALSSENIVEMGDRITVNRKELDPQSAATYTLSIPANSQIYLNLPNIVFSNDSVKKVVITVKNQSREFTLDNTFSFFNVGYFLENQDVTFTISFPDNEQVSFDKPQFYRLDLLAYQNAMATLLEKTVTVRTSGNVVTADFDTDKETSLFFTLPYDKGWTAKVDGQEVAITRAQQGFMKVTVKPGQKQVVLTFVPNGFYIGLMCSGLAMVLFASYQIFRSYFPLFAEKNKNQERIS